MRVSQIQVSDVAVLEAALAEVADKDKASLLLAFGAPALVGDERVFALLRAASPAAIVTGCSTAGEITNAGIADDTLVITFIQFEKLALSMATAELAGMDDSTAAGRRLGETLRANDPAVRAVLLFGQGVNINGSALIDGMRAALGDSVIVTGGLAGDGTRFKKTWVVTPAGPSSSALVALGLSGEALRFNHGSFGGWEPFGVLRKVTRARGNILYELDGRPALDIYKSFLGDYAKDLPASGLLFPFEMVSQIGSKTGVIRTILGIDEHDGSLTLAGDIDPEGYLQLMHASADRLVNGAESAAMAAKEMAAHPGGGLGLLISCVGRKLVMGDRIDEEIEAVGDVFGKNTMLTGFYSYGEISPYAPGASCRLHNQTMTVTWIAEDTD